MGVLEHVSHSSDSYNLFLAFVFSGEFITLCGEILRCNQTTNVSDVIVPFAFCVDFVRSSVS